jgi:hypothetical protein
MGNDIATAIEEATPRIEAALVKCNATELASLPTLSKAVRLAAGINELRKALTSEIMERVIMPLQGSPLGFVTDKDKDGGYPPEVVRDCMIEGMIRGLQPVNNEINIISGRCYAAKNGMKRLVTTFPGLTDLRITPGVPTLAGDKGAVISMRATWNLNGQPMEIYRGIQKDKDGVVTDDTRIAVRVNSGMGPDAIIGKAERKIFKAIYELVSGASIPEGDEIDTVGEVVQAGPTPPPAPPEQDGRRIKLGGNGKAKNPDPPQEPAMREPGDEP